MRVFKLFSAVCLMVLATWSSLQAQGRQYIDMVYPASTVSRTTTIYGTNYTLMPYAQGKRAAPQLLQTTVFSSNLNTSRNRPLIIFMHTGNFLPYGVNGACGGTMTDSSNVEIATRLARMGYVVALTTYRLFWNPLAAQELTRRFLLINAAYRGVQDARTAIRFFKRTVKEQGNRFGVDTTRITLWGQGTGGYISLATAYLNTYNEILTTSDPNKYILPLNATTRVPMVREQYNGDIYGTSGPHTVDAQYNAYTGFPIGDTLAVPNHVGHTSNFQLCVNMGGALGDSTWLDRGEVPLISFHVPSDGFAPCKTDVLNVPTTTGPQPVVEVSGSCDLSTYVDRYGNNAVFATIPSSLPDPYGAVGRARSGGRTGFFPFVGTPANSSSPWEWVLADPPGATGCNKNSSSARTYIDTIVGYFAPRAYLALRLGTISTKEPVIAAQSLQIAPNPATETMVFTAENEITGIDLYDVSGRLVRTIPNIKTTQYTLQREGIEKGLYIARIRFAEGIAARKILFE